jgi:hypothetical protein
MTFIQHGSQADREQIKVIEQTQYNGHCDAARSADVAFPAVQSMRYIIPEMYGHTLIHIR